MLTRRFILASSAAAVFAPQVFAAASKPEIFMDLQGRALKGYDTVAYHTERKAVKGKEDFQAEWKGAIWWFASAENKEKFVADPERWAPQYGGYCAWAVAKGWARPINPTIFRIFDDKLYLNLNMKIHKTWLKKHKVFIVRADEKWPGILDVG